MLFKWLFASLVRPPFLYAVSGKFKVFFCFTVVLYNIAEISQSRHNQRWCTFFSSSGRTFFNREPKRDCFEQILTASLDAYALWTFLPFPIDFPCGLADTGKQDTSDRCNILCTEAVGRSEGEFKLVIQQIQRISSFLKKAQLRPGG